MLKQIKNLLWVNEFEWIFDMAMVYVAVVEGLDSSGFSGLFFGILNFLMLFQLLDVPFSAIASLSSFAFKKKQQNVNDFYFMKEVAFKE